ncbi:MAG: osmotically inducible protein OsmC [Sphingomonas bacterium]|jgi:osmotically inducible protein OsmC|uniref:OsmC family protein n=1 Tax=Sphingomonas bacterium TaxID=1895847 RepID=UPI0026167B1F|nr:OsmC family protein [Sphingomonas bacterium]MDB5703774.1 osmotically inducible protein OsmC [Sphingomonas bacterium]
MTTRSGSARYEGFGKDGVGHVSTQSGALADIPYGFSSRFEEGPGTNPEELIATAHASCFTMALSFALARAGFSAGTLETTAKVTLEKQDAGFTITRSDLDLTATIDGIEPDQFAEIAADAKANCPVSKVLNAEITLTHRLNA